MLVCHPFKGNSNHTTQSSSSEDIDIYDIVAVALKFGLRMEDLKDMTLVSLSNIIYSYTRKREPMATQKDIDAFLG